MLQLPRSAWDKVSLDLFGPTPTINHILVAQDVITRFPAAHIVPGTKASSVLPVLDNICISYGYPDIHITDNDPPFNSEQFSDYSRQKVITHQQIYPYHQWANPAERLMKPSGKALKTATMDHRTEQEALKEFLVSCHATRDIAAGVPPGDFLFSMDTVLITLSEIQLTKNRWPTQEIVTKHTKKLFKIRLTNL